MKESLKRFDEDEISIREVFLKVIEWKNYLLSKWKLILVVSVIGGGLGIVVSVFSKPIYKGELTFVAEGEGNNSAMGMYSGIASQFGINLGGGEGNTVFTGDNLVELLKSRSIIEKTLLSDVEINGKKQLLANYYIDFNKLQKSWSNKPKLKDFYFPTQTDRKDFSILQDSVLGTFFKDIKSKHLFIAKVDKKLSLISVNCKSTDEVFSKVFVESLMKTVTTFYVETKTKKSRVIVESLQAKTDSVKALLDGKIYGLAVAKDENLRVVRARGNVNEVRQTRDIQILNIMYAELVKNLELTKMTLMRETPLIQVIDYPILPLEKERLSKSKGLIMGAFIAFFGMMVYFVMRGLYHQFVLNEGKSEN